MILISTVPNGWTFSLPGGGGGGTWMRIRPVNFSVPPSGSVISIDTGLSPLVGNTWRPITTQPLPWFSAWRTTASVTVPSPQSIEAL